MALVGRAIYDDGAMVSRSPDLAAVTPGPFVELHPDEAAARGLTEGVEVAVTSDSGSIRAPLRISTDTPRGAVFLPFDQPGLSANALMDAKEPATYVDVRGAPGGVAAPRSGAEGEMRIPPTSEAVP